MQFRFQPVLACLIATLATSGCATAGPTSDPMRDAIYSTHRMVQDLSSSLGGTVDQLTRTTAELTARLDATDQELRQLGSVAQENQRKLERLQASLDSMTTTLYRHFNLSPPQPVAMPTPVFPSGPAIPRGGVVIEPPPATGPPTTTLPSGGLGAEFTPPPERTPAPGIDPVSHYRAAQQLYAREDYAKARDQFAEHLRLFPDSEYTSNAMYWNAHCYFKLGEYQEAIAGFDRLRAKFPASDKVPTAMHNQAVAYSRLGQNARAVELFQRLIREYPDDPATAGARQKLRQLQGLN